MYCIFVVLCIHAGMTWLLILGVAASFIWSEKDAHILPEPAVVEEDKAVTDEEPAPVADPAAVDQNR